MKGENSARAYDAVVVGGSLAGAATAIHLAEAGRSVVLLEQARAFKRKACGE
ncbi:MAG: FAD-dependent oxidoreductase [Tepidiformaceae bacterium]